MLYAPARNRHCAADVVDGALMATILSSAVNTLGSGYHAGDQIYVGVLCGLENFVGQIASVDILTVDGAGVPLTYILPEQHWGVGYYGGGSCYSVASGVACGNGPGPFGGGGHGHGFTLDILSVGAGNDAARSGNVFPIDGSLSSGYAVGDTGFLVQGSFLAPYTITGVFGAGQVNGAAICSSEGDAPVGAIGSTISGPQPGAGSGLAAIGFSVSGTINLCSRPP